MTPALGTDEVSCLIGPGASFEGLVCFDGAIRIEGRLRGELVGDGRVEIAPGARVEARLRVGEVRVAGELEGEIEARTGVWIAAGGRVRGTLRTPRLAVAEGAHLEASVAMGEAAAGGRRRGSRGASAA
jgi:cytoskeletal protein CcmA (bactofilin family)